ncbi:MAG: efflux RND transporter permease subunit, partial [Verrucomicrobiae bacterium]|nr:efflux RND transporter permease subunit [Verrucomicrobiae bacterium]
KAMHEITGALIAITLVMGAVFLPVAFMSGPSGILYRQFSLTIAVAIALSGFVALTMTPALCALILRNPHASDARPGGHRAGVVARLLAGFNRSYEALADRYAAVVRPLAGSGLATWMMFIALSGIAAYLGLRLPKGFIPNEDQGTFYVSITTPAGATLERTKAVVEAIQSACSNLPAIKSISSLAGANILSDGTGPTYGTCLFNLVPWDQRTDSVEAVMDQVRTRIAHVRDARLEVFPPPAVPGYGNASGFELRLLDKTGSGDLQQMDEVLRRFLEELKRRPEIGNAFTIFDNSFPQFVVHVDTEKAAKKGITATDAMDELQTLLGSEYASNFIRFGRRYKVMVQALPGYRSSPDDLLRFHIKNDAGEMIPLSTFARLEPVPGSDQITRYNMFPSAEINGEQAPGYSSGDAIRAIQETAREKLPRGYDIDWAGISRDEVLAGNEAVLIFGICLVFVYLLLAAQYESFLLPLAVILSLPAGLMGALCFLRWMGLENNIYSQMALLMLIGLLGKNAILIVEFASIRHREGRSPLDAAVEAARARLRPILMTSLAFVAGLIPLLLSSGVGAIGNRTLGAAATGGMLFGTVFGVLVTPGLYIVFATVAQRPGRRESLPLSEEA